MNKKLLLLSGVIFFILSGCTLIPKYERPAAPVPNQWPTGAAYNQTMSNTNTAKIPWRDFITDLRLQKVIEMSLNNNRDMRVAALNVERARALYGIQRSELLPTVNAIGSMNKGRTPADLTTNGIENTYEQYSVNLGIISWEIDFFGRIRSLKENVFEQYLATDQARLSTQILLISSVAGAYFTLAADREALKLSISTLEAQETTYRLVRKRLEVGLASELDLYRIKSQVDTAKADVARYTQLAARDENALNLLAGSTVPKNLEPLELANISPPKEVSAGLSSEILLNRPDILAAEHGLKAANANIGAARAAFFPRISLTTTIGTASASLSGLFKDGSSTWNFAPTIIMPIFDARTWFAYDVTKVDKDISIAQYEKAIQAAFREVADSLAVQGTVNQQISAQQSLVDAVNQTYRLSTARYLKGIDSYLGVLDAQRSLYSAQQGLIGLHLTKLNNMIVLYKALGGGV